VPCAGDGRWAAEAVAGAAVEHVDDPLAVVTLIGSLMPSDSTSTISSARSGPEPETLPLPGFVGEQVGVAAGNSRIALASDVKQSWVTL
jgi:hypothetical protein